MTRMIDGCWPCMVCGRWRPDAAIGVAKRTVVLPGTLTVISPFNVRYCLDDAGCAAAATAAGAWAGWSAQARRVMTTTGPGSAGTLGLGSGG